MNYINNQTYDTERALYNTSDALVMSCIFKGPSDGESVLKECRSIIVQKCEFDLRYPIWHAYNYKVIDSIFSINSRAPLWYCEYGQIINSKIYGVKAVRECSHLEINNSEIKSTEFGWKSQDIKVNNSSIVAEYLFLDSKDIEIYNLEFKGKYSFQYVENVKIDSSNLDTKDAFWHSKNVTVTNSIIKGQYLGWFSEGLTLIHCKIIGTQPLCYCKKLKLIDCEMIDCDLSFEYSEVEATIKGYIESIKNPKSGTITVDKVGKIIKSDSIMECSANIILTNKQFR